MPVRRKTRNVNEILKNEERVDLQSDPVWYPENPEGDQEIKRREEAVSTLIKSTEMQAANSRIAILEEMWKMERWLNNQLETTLSKVEGERNELQAQPVKIVEGGSASRKAPNKRKWNKIEKNKPKEEENKKRIEPCKTCGKNHKGVCLKGKNVCYNCKQEGHLANKCPNSKKDTCFNCGAVGHQAKMCPMKGEKASGELKIK